MFKEGTIETSNSLWSSPIVIVPKHNRSLQLCTDFWRLNAISEFDSYPLPRVNDIIGSYPHPT